MWSRLPGEQEVTVALMGNQPGAEPSLTAPDRPPRKQTSTCSSLFMGLSREIVMDGFLKRHHQLHNSCCQQVIKPFYPFIFFFINHSTL